MAGTKAGSSTVLPKKSIAFIAMSAEYIGIVLMVVMSCITMYQVIARFVFHNPTSWSEELSVVLMTWIGYLGIAIGIKERKHTTVDYFVNLLPPSVQKVVNWLNDVLILAFHAGMVYYGSILYKTSEGVSLPATDISMSSVYSVLIIGGGLNVLFGLVQVLGLERRLFGQAQ